MTNRQHLTEAIYHTSVRHECSARMLVLRAAEIEYEMRRDAGGLVLLVSEDDAGRARAELDAYEQENPQPAPVAAPPAASIASPRHAWTGVAVYVAIVVAVAVFRNRDFLGYDWFEAGKTHAASILEGQWWRTVTALTLHADVPHLIGNILVGGLFGLFAGQLLGSGLAWCSILIAGALGNLLNAWIRHADHTSVGASTAVFASLGLVAALAWVRRAPRRESRLARWAPLVGAAVLLSYLGTGGERTDVFAHVTGFVAGLCLGVVYGKLGDRIRFAAHGQVLLGVLAVAAIVFSWMLALDSQSLVS